MRAALAVLLALALAPAAAAEEWQDAGYSRIPLTYYQGVTSDPAGSLYFDGIFTGLYRADARLREQAAQPNVIPPDVFAREGFNHIGDIAWDRREGGRILLPLECYVPNTPNGGNTCGKGAFGVADPRTLAWRYYVLLDPAEIPKAMWAETSPDGDLVWTSSGADLLAYRAADIRPGAGPLRAVKRLAGAVPPPGITGAAFYGERLLLAGQSGGTFQVWSVDLASGARTLEIQRELSGESEGLLTYDGLGGVLHWIVTPVDPLMRPPTYGFGSNVLLHFRPAAPRPTLRARATRAGRAVRVSARGPAGPLAGAVVRAGDAWAVTSAAGTVRLAVGDARRLTVSRPDLRHATVRVPAR